MLQTLCWQIHLHKDMEEQAETESLGILGVPQKKCSCVGEKFSV